MKKKNNKVFIINILLGLLLFSWIIWVRFIRFRLPRDIPFSLSLFSLLIIIIICIIFVYKIMQLIKPIQESILTKQKQSFWYSKLIPVLQLFIKPLCILQETIIINKYVYPLISNLIEKFIKIFIKLQSYKHRRDDYLYICGNILPRIFLLIFLCIDIFYFHQIKLFYTMLPLGIIPMFFSFMNACIKVIYERNIQYLEKRFMIELALEEQTEENDSEYLYDSFMYPRFQEEEFSHLLLLRNFVEIQASSIWLEKKLHKYKCVETLEARIDYANTYNITLTNFHITESNFDDISIELSKEFYTLISYTIYLYLFIICQEKKSLFNGNIRTIFKINYSLFLICWIYILLTADFNNVNLNFLYFLINFGDSIEPFSGNIINNMSETS